MKTTLTKLTLIMTVAFLTSCSGLRYPESYLTKAPKKKVETAQKEELKSIQQIDQNQIASTKSEKGIIDDQQVRKETEKTESAIMEKPSVQKKSSAFEKKAQRIEKKLNSIAQKRNEFKSDSNVSSISNADLITIILVVLLIALLLALLPGNVAYLIVVLALIFLILYLLGVI